jgi:hypothetical protein
MFSWKNQFEFHIWKLQILESFVLITRDTAVYGYLLLLMLPVLIGVKKPIPNCWGLIGEITCKVSKVVSLGVQRNEKNFTLQSD